MKKYLVAIALMIACQSTFAQSTKDIFEEFGKDANNVVIPELIEI